MNEVIVNTQEIESIWGKDNLCFVKMKSGKVWICPQSFDLKNTETGGILKEQTADYIQKNNGLIWLPLSNKGGQII